MSFSATVANMATVAFFYGRVMSGSLGIICGLLAAFFQTLSYLATRHYVQPREAGGEVRSSRQLLVLAHIHMGVVSVLVLPWIWPATPVPWEQVWNPLIQTALFYLLGQVGLVIALKYAEPSRVSPMLGFKLVILAGMTAALTTEGLTPLKWGAVLVALAGALMLNYTGGKNHPRALLGIVLACVAYSLSDWNIKRLVDAMSWQGGSEAATKMPAWQASMMAAFVCYALCGVMAIPFLPRLGSKKWREWVDAAPFAGAWMGGMIFLFFCFALVGVVYGNILQSTRGLMSVLMGTVLASWGLLHLETVKSRHVFVRRLVAAGLMLLAVGMYKWEPKKGTPEVPPEKPVAKSMK